MAGRKDRPKGAMNVGRKSVSNISTSADRQKVLARMRAMRSPTPSGMTRTDFLRTAGVAAAGVGAAAVGLGGVAKAAPPFGQLVDGWYEVYPMNNPEWDISNVQLAVLGLEMLPYPPYVQEIPDFEGKVRLKSVAYGTETPTPFNFYVPDTPTSVAILLPVIVKGDGFNADGTPKTVINGGGGSTPEGPLAALTIFFGADPTIPLIPGPVKIDGLWLDGQTMGAIGGFSFFDVEIANNMITHVTSQATSVLGIEGDYRMAMMFSRAMQPFWPPELPPPTWPPNFPPPWPENPPKVLIHDNVIDNRNEMSDPDALVSADLGIATVGMYDTVEICNNTVSNRGIPIELNCNLGPTSKIIGNVVQTQMREIDFQDAGIWAMCHYGNSHITNNNITLLEGSAGCGFMLSNPQGTYEVSGNTLTMESGFTAFHVGDPGFCFVAVASPLVGAVIKNNAISGTASNAIVAMDYPGFPEGDFWNDSNNNLFVGNNMTDFTPTGGWPFPLPPVHVFLGPNTFGNELRGYFGGSDSVVDLNPFGPYADQPNFITGYSKKGGSGIGQQMSETMKAKVALKKQAMGAITSTMAKAAKAMAEALGQQ